MPLAERLGGAEHTLWTVAVEMSRRGEKLRVIFQQDGPFVAEIKGLGHEAEVIPEGSLTNLPGVLMTSMRLKRAIKHFKPEVVVSWVERSQLYVGLAYVGRRKSSRPRLVWWNHTAKGGRLERAVTRLPADHVLVASKAAQELQESFKPKRDVIVVNPGIPDPDTTKDDSCPTHEDLGLRKDALVIGIVGRLQPWKRQDRLIEAVAKLRSHDPERDVQLLIIGGDAHGYAPEYEPALHALVDKLGLGDSVIFTGQVPSADPYLGLIDVLVNASDVEPFGIVLLEGMAFKLPVVAVAAGGPLEIIEDGVNGILVESSDPLDLAAGIDRLKDPAERARIGAAGARTVLERYSPAVMTDKLLAAIRE